LKIAKLLSVLLVSVSSFASLTVSQPVSGTTVSNPIRVVASDYQAVSFRIYVDGNSVYYKSGSSIDTSISVGSGEHNVVVQSWDKYGNVEKYPLNVTAKSTSYAHKISSLEEGYWGNCGTCGNHPGDDRYVWGTQNIGYTKALNGKSAKFSVGGNHPYTNYYWYVKSGWGTQVNSVKISFDMYLPDGSDPQAIEFETQYRWKGWLYNLSIQLGYKSLRLRTFDRNKNTWLDTGMSFSPPSRGDWHHIEAEFAIDHSGHRRKLIAVTIDGNRKTPSSAVYLPGKYQSGLPNYMTVAAFQLDMNGDAEDYGVYVDNYTFQYQ
jgi:hypothetical protein